MGVVFFFQAEDGIRDGRVTGVQTCALPILDDTAAIAPRLAPHDWHLVPPELDARPWRRLLVKVADNRRAAHLHLLRPATRRWTEQLEFRDRLRASPGLVSEYGALERRLAGGLA